MAERHNLPPGWIETGKPYWYLIDFKEMFNKVPLTQIIISKPVGYEEYNNLQIKWIEENAQIDNNLSKLHNRPKSDFTLNLDKYTETRTINLSNRKTKNIGVQLWNLLSWNTNITPYWNLVVQNLSEARRNIKAIDILRRSCAYDEEFTDIDLLITYLAGTISGLCTCEIPIRTEHNTIIETLGLCVLHVGIFGGGRSTLLTLLKRNTPFWTDPGMTSSMKGLIQLMKNCPIGPIIDEEFGESLTAHDTYQQGKARAFSKLVSDRRVGDETLERGQEIAEVQNISVIGAANELDPFLADGKIASHLYIVRYPDTKGRSLRIAQEREGAYPQTFDEAVSRYEETLSNGMDIWSPEVIRWANFIISNIASGRVLVEWDGRIYSIPALSGIIFSKKDEWWNRVKSLYSEGSSIEEDVFSATRWMTMGERVMWNCAINEILNRKVYIRPPSITKEGTLVRGEMLLEICEDDASWGYMAVDRQLPERKELYLLFKGRSKERFVLNVIKQNELMKKLLKFVNSVIQAGDFGIHKDILAISLGVTPRTIQDYITETQKLGFSIELDRGVCRVR